MKKIISLLVCLLVLLTLCACGGSSEEKYTGSAQGAHGTVEVTITVKDGKVTACEATGADENADLWPKVVEKLPQEVVEKNSADVDIAAGATISSNAFIEAAHAAFKAAGLE